MRRDNFDAFEASTNYTNEPQTFTNRIEELGQTA
jgi:hypothetical protein